MRKSVLMIIAVCALFLGISVHAQTKSVWLASSFPDFDPVFCNNSLFTYADTAASSSSSGPAIDPSMPINYNNETYQRMFKKTLGNFAKKQVKSTTVQSGNTTTTADYSVYKYHIPLFLEEARDLHKIFNMKTVIPGIASDQMCWISFAVAVKKVVSYEVHKQNPTTLTMHCNKITQPGTLTRDSWTNATNWSDEPKGEFSYEMPRDKFHVLSQCSY